MTTQSRAKRAERPQGERGASDVRGAASDAAGAATRSLTVVLPVPEKLLNENVRGMHWGAKARHVRVQRQTAALTARANVWQLEGEALFSGTVRIDIEVRPRPRMNKLDDDNFWAAMKSYRDGLADARIVLDDKQFRMGSLTWGEARSGEIVFTLTEEG